MNFEQLDEQMRVFERAMDQFIMPGVWMVARIDGRNFTRLTKEICQYEAPFGHILHFGRIIYAST